MNHRETQARKTYQDAQRAVIKACEDLREAEMFLDSFERGERSAVGGAAARAASTGDIKNSHASNLREQVQLSKVIHADYAPDEYAESQLLEAASALQKAALVLGSPLMRHWFDERLLARAQGDLMQIQVAMLAKLQRLNARAFEVLQASAEHGEGGDAA